MSLRKRLKKFLLRTSDDQTASGKIFSAAKNALLFLDGLREIVVANLAVSRLSETEKARLFPSFLGIGAQKSATSWLHVALRAHPEIYLPARRKEVHFFDVNQWKGMDWYRWHFRDGGGKMLGEITPKYSILSREKIAEIHRLNPNLKPILLLRNPIERAWSMTCMDILRNRARKISDVPKAEFLRHFDRADALARGDYETVLENWLSVFPENQLFIGFYEQVAQQPDVLLRDIFRFLGVNPDVQIPPEILTEKINTTNYPLPNDLAAELSRMYGPKIESLHQRLKSPFTENWVKSLTSQI